jgi:sugar O-acyltransferase (sialic acid O-acetyltransferase NeuD family)
VTVERVERVVIVGAGGHAREVLEILLARRAAGAPLEPVGFLDEASADPPATLNGLPVLGGFEWFATAERDGLSAICAVRTPSVCERLAERVRALGVPIASAIAPEAWIATTASLGEGVMVFPGVVVNANAVIGDHVTLNVSSSVSHDARIGAFGSIGPGARIAGNATLGSRCFVGMGASVIHGVRVGDGSVIGAGAVVLEDVPAGMTAVGTPARVVGPASETPMRRRAGGR